MSPHLHTLCLRLTTSELLGPFTAPCDGEAFTNEYRAYAALLYHGPPCHSPSCGINQSDQDHNHDDDDDRVVPTAIGRPISARCTHNLFTNKSTGQDLRRVFESPVLQAGSWLRRIRPGDGCLFAE